MEKVWVIQDPDEYTRVRRPKPVRKEELTPEKSPAVSYSLSMFCWGAGQLFNRQQAKGAAFMVLMFLTGSGAFLARFYREDLILFTTRLGLSRASLFLVAEALILSILFFWAYNAGDAYHGANRERENPFTGVSSRVYPVLCSLLVPGWGQFLNGQPVKGSIFTGFSIFGFFSMTTLFSVLLAWPSLEPSDSRFIVEAIFMGSVLFALLIPFIWLFSAYDALQVSLDDYRKEPLWERIKAANNRRRVQGWVRGVFPQIKATVALGLFLVLFVIIAYRYFPASYYDDVVLSVGSSLKDRGMTLAPELIDRLHALMTMVGR